MSKLLSYFWKVKLQKNVFCHRWDLNYSFWKNRDELSVLTTRPEFGFFFIIFVYCVFSWILLIIFRVCIFVYLLTINFVRVSIVYFQKYCVFVNYNKFHYQLLYVQIAHIYYIPCTCNYSIYFCYFIWIYMYLCCLFHIFKCEFRYSIICGPWP